MHTTPNAELDRRINAAISRQLAPPPASLTLTDAALLAHCAIDAANNANVPIVLARWMPMACSVTSLVRITPCSSAIRWPRKGMDRRGAQDADPPARGRRIAWRQPVWLVAYARSVLLRRWAPLLVRRRTARRYRHQRRERRGRYRDCHANPGALQPRAFFAHTIP